MNHSHELMTNGSYTKRARIRAFSLWPRTSFPASYLFHIVVVMYPLLTVFWMIWVRQLPPVQCYVPTRFGARQCAKGASSHGLQTCSYPSDRSRNIRQHVPFESTSADFSLLSSQWGTGTTGTSISDETLAAASANDPAVGLSEEATIAVFIIGLIPFGIATIEFWRRIAVGASFGTSEPVVFTIGEDDAPSNSRGKQILGRDALVTAYVIFAVAAVVLCIVAAAVLTSPAP